MQQGLNRPTPYIVARAGLSERRIRIETRHKALEQRDDLTSPQRALERRYPLVLDLASDIRELSNALPKRCAAVCARSPQTAHTILGESSIEEVLASL